MENSNGAARVLVPSKLKYHVFQDKELPSDWHVEAIDAETGDIYSAVFGNANAEQCAREYAAWRESSIR